MYFPSCLLFMGLPPNPHGGHLWQACEGSEGVTRPPRSTISALEWWHSLALFEGLPPHPRLEASNFNSESNNEVHTLGWETKCEHNTAATVVLETPNTTKLHNRKLLKIEFLQNSFFWRMLFLVSQTKFSTLTRSWREPAVRECRKFAFERQQKNNSKQGL